MIDFVEITFNIILIFLVLPVERESKRVGLLSANLPGLSIWGSLTQCCRFRYCNSLDTGSSHDKKVQGFMHTNVCGVADGFSYTIFFLHGHDVGKHSYYLQGCRPYHWGLL
jgi:hypothetical protein